jgi:LPXTG-motif cell wall-anchored protein
MRWFRYLALVLITALGAASLLGAGASAATAAPTVTVTQNSTLGSVLVGPNGMTLYYFLKDSANVNNCTGTCAGIWPPLTVASGTVPWGGAGVTGTFGTIASSSGKVQVTYNGWPLYYYAGDTKVGDTNGQGLFKLWYVATPTLAQAPTKAATTTAPASSTASRPATTLSVVNNSTLGAMLVGPNGMTVYRFLKDTRGVDNCIAVAVCAKIWFPVTVTSTPTVGSGVTGTVGTITLSNGSKQVTYNGWPLYYYAGDTKVGDTTGQGFKDLWYIVSPSQAEAPLAAASTAPSTSSASSSTLPKTGSGPLPVAAGVILLASGALLLSKRLRHSA